MSPVTLSRGNHLTGQANDESTRFLFFAGNAMRVIAGKAKGTRLSSLKGDLVRPTLDRVKESFFNQVRPVLTGAKFLDLFAGTGSIGIEALSQGASRVVFVEINPRAQAMIYRNLEKCRMWRGTGDSKITEWVLLKSNVLHALRVLDERQDRFDLVYLDPPFQEGLYEETLTTLAESRLLDPSSQVIAEHYHKKALSENYGKLLQTKSRRIGDTTLTFYMPDS